MHVDRRRDHRHRRHRHRGPGPLRPGARPGRASGHVTHPAGAPPALAARGPPRRPGQRRRELVVASAARRSSCSEGASCGGDGVLEVTDPFLGEHHRCLPTVRNGQAECIPTEREPDLRLDAGDLASIYLGGTSPSTLAHAGHVGVQDDAARVVTDAPFRAEREPYCLHWF
nr:sterol carrier protein domain-containing protein [Kineococcus indalonis]